jgi:polysaccharide biosynthesis protein PslH
MNILQLCNKSPLPPKEGGSIAMFHLAKALISNGHNVDVLAVTTPKYCPDHKDIEKYLEQSYTWEQGFVDTKVTIAGALKALFSSGAYHVSRFDNHDFRKQLIRKLSQKKYDVVIFETLYMSPYLQDVKQHSDAICVLRSHNIEHQIWQRVAANESNVLKKIYLRHLASRLEQYEKNNVGLYDAIACISEAEQIYYRVIAPGCNALLVPFGMDLTDSVSSASSGNGFYHIGAMDWMPNIEGIQWLLKEVVPLLHNEEQSPVIALAGRNMPQWLLDNTDDCIEIVGEVDDAAEFVASKSVLVVPLLSGSGIRIKIIEAMAAGKTVVSTSIGAEGIRVTNGEDIVIADTPQSFARAIMRVFKNPQTQKEIGEKAAQLIKDQHSYATAYIAFMKVIGK